MVVVKYEVKCPFCNTMHMGEIEMRYRKDKKFNVRYNNKNVHICTNKNCGKKFVVEIDSLGTVVSMPTQEIIEEGIFPWDRLSEGRIVKLEDN